MANKKQKRSLKYQMWSTIRVLLIGALFYLGVTLIFFGSGFGNSYVVQQNAQKANTTLTQKKADRNKNAQKITMPAKISQSVRPKFSELKQLRPMPLAEILIPVSIFIIPFLPDTETRIKI